MKISFSPALIRLLVLMQLSGCAVVSLMEKPVSGSKTQTGQIASNPPETAPAFAATPQPETIQATTPRAVPIHQPALEEPVVTQAQPPVQQTQQEVSPSTEPELDPEPEPVQRAQTQETPHFTTEDVTPSVNRAQAQAEPQPDNPTLTRPETQAITHPVPHTAPRAAKEADVEIALAKPDPVLEKAGVHSMAKDPATYRKEAARHLYRHYAHRIYKGKLPPMLKGIGVVDVVIGATGQVVDIRWIRAPKHAPELSLEIENLIRIAGPFPAPVHLRQVTYTETWLWHISGKFQLDTLTEGQQ